MSSSDRATNALFEAHGYPTTPIVMKDRIKLSGTNIRKLMLERYDKWTGWTDYLPAGSVIILKNLKGIERIRSLQE